MKLKCDGCDYHCELDIPIENSETVSMCPVAGDAEWEPITEE